MWQIHGKRVVGDWKGKKVDIPHTWSNHMFSNGELTDLFSGKSIIVTTVSNKNNKKFTAELRIDNRENNENYPNIGIVPTFIHSNPSKPTVANSNNNSNNISRVYGWQTHEQTNSISLAGTNHSFSPSEMLILNSGGIVVFEDNLNNESTYNMHAVKLNNNILEEVNLYV